MPLLPRDDDQAVITLETINGLRDALP